MKEGFTINGFDSSEIVIGLVGAVGTSMDLVVKYLTERFRAYNYDKCITLKVSENIIREFPSKTEVNDSNRYERIKSFILKGNEARESSQNSSILAYGISSYINGTRGYENDIPKPNPKHVYIIDSLKHPKEVEVLRQIYGQGFYLFSVYENKNRRKNNLTQNDEMTDKQALELIEIDMAEANPFGQQTRDTFEMADFFISIDDADNDKLRNAITRILDLIFGNPYLTPTFDEYAMFIAFASSTRSADLSRQIGAVITNSKNEIIASGVNDCPKPGGGLYWPELNKDKEYIDLDNGRDYKLGYDSNKMEIYNLVVNIADSFGIEDYDDAFSRLSKSNLFDITEYGRIVHAEMEAILLCARNGISTKGTTLYCTTYPCHNCAKHIIASGIKKVFYIEPYPKSKAMDFYGKNALQEEEREEEDREKVSFLPFVGVGPRRFFDFFSMKSVTTGHELKRKDKKGYKLDWSSKKAKIRCQLTPFSYLDNEIYAKNEFSKNLKKQGEK